MTDVHVHLPENFSGSVHIHRDDGVTTISAEIPSAGEDGPTSPSSTADIEAILSRHAHHTAQSRSREAYAALIDQGWTVRSLKSRSGAASSTASYLRFVYAGSAHRVVLYLNSVALVCNATAERELAARLPAAEAKSSGVYFYFDEAHGGIEQAMKNAAALRDRADSDNG